MPRDASAAAGGGQTPAYMAQSDSLGPTRVRARVRPYASVYRTGRAVSLRASCERPLSFTPDARGDLRGPSHREGGHADHIPG